MFDFTLGDSLYIAAKTEPFKRIDLFGSSLVVNLVSMFQAAELTEC